MADNTRQVTLRIAAEDAWSQTVKDLTGALAMLPKDVLASMQQTNAAFAKLGLKSTLNVDMQKRELVQAFSQIKGSGIVSAEEVERAYGKLKAELRSLDGKTRESTQNFKQLSTDASKSIENTNGVLGAMGQYVIGAFSVGAIIGFVKESFNATMQMDSINSKLKVLAGSNAGAAAEWEFIRNEAKRLGLDLQQTAEAYSSFAVATKNTSMEGEAARRMFTSVSEAATALHLPADQAGRVLYQFQQMLSKGKVNMEDLKTASESFPGLLKQVADALGITTAKLLDQMQKGELMSAEVLPKLGEQLHKTYGTAATEAADKGRGAINRMTTELFLFKQQVGEDTAPGLIKFGQTMVNISKAVVGGWQLMVVQVAYTYDFIKTKMDLSQSKAATEKRLQEITAAYDNQIAAITARYGKGKNDIAAIEKDSADITARNSQRRRDEAKKTGEDLAKINLDYAKAINQSEDELTANAEKEYQNRIKDVKAYYDQKKAAAKSDGEELAWEKLKTATLKNMAEQHARDNEIITARMIQRAIDLRKEGLEVEINAIKMQAVDRTITEEDAARKITELTVTSLRDQYTARQYVAEKIAAIYGKDSDDYKKALKEQQTSHKSYIDANFNAYKNYSDKIRSLDKEIADFRRSIQEKISDLKQKGMTDEQKYADNLARFNAAIDASDSARRQKKTEEALRYSKQAEELASRLGDTQTAKINGVKAAEEALRQVEENRVKILEGQKDEAQESLDKLKLLNDQKLDPKRLELNLDEAALSRVTEEISNLTKTEKKSIVIETIGPASDPRYTNYQVPGMATGGRVGGYGIGDTQLRLLDPREHVIRPEATAFWGDGLLSAFNAPWTAAGQLIASRLANVSVPNIPMAPSFTMAAGGPVGTLQDMGTLDLKFGNRSYPVIGKVDVLAELKTALRRETLKREQ